MQKESNTPVLIWNQDRKKECLSISELFTIGQDPINQLSFDEDSSVSPRHARIEAKPQGFIIRDLRSATGTYVNGTQILEAHLHHGDSIQIGEQTLSFHTRKLPECQLSSHNQKWQEQLLSLPRLADNNFSILLLGPSGTGKDILANEIHRLSPRKKGPFISVNCCALSESLIESELFGHVRGSFTGATGDRKGAFETARNGTLFLDEIGDLSPNLQAKLLRALENQEIKPVGSDHSITTDTRILAATHQNLQKKVQQGTFRADLYYRLAILQITPPSLIERMEDFESLLFQFCKNNHACFSHDAIEELKKHSWPGNIRELKNTILRASALYKEKRVLKEHIPSLIDRCFKENIESPSLKEGFDKKNGLSIIKQMEKKMILKFLKANRGNQRQTAAALGLPKSTLNDRIKSYKINIDELFPATITI